MIDILRIAALRYYAISEGGRQQQRPVSSRPASGPNLHPTKDAQSNAAELSGGQVSDLVGGRSGAKKPYEWLGEAQFDNLQLLAANFPFFAETYEKLMRADGREAPWRAIAESDMPEQLPLPDPVNSECTLLQKACIVRALRPDRSLNACIPLITQVLGKKYAHTSTYNASSAYVIII